MDEIYNPLRYCRYYNGEEKCPFDMSTMDATYWSIEETWIKLVNPHPGRRNALTVEYIAETDRHPYIKAPVTLKATLYEIYCQYHSLPTDFDNFIKTYVNRRQPNEKTLLLQS